MSAEILKKGQILTNFRNTCMHDFVNLNDMNKLFLRPGFYVTR